MDVIVGTCKGRQVAAAESKDRAHRAGTMHATESGAVHSGARFDEEWKVATFRWNCCVAPGRRGPRGRAT